jgi:hypothetical protein
MKTIILGILLFAFTNQVKTQTYCSPYYTVNTIFYPNTVTDYTNNLSVLYLCGPNTVVYDTTAVFCRWVYVNSGCTYIINQNGCPHPSTIYLKNNATLIIKANVYTDGFNVVSEPSTTIINSSTLTLGNYTCAAISFPTVNCSATGIKSFENESDRVSLYPNPVNETLQLNYENFNDNDNYKIGIYNSIGQPIREEEILFKNNTAVIDTKNIPNGVYVLKLSSRGTRDLSADPSYRQDENLITVSKRFVVPR